MKSLLTTFLVFFAICQMYGATGFGIQVSTGYSSARVDNKSEDYDISDGKNRIKLGIGFIYDLQFNENAYFSTGLLYKTKYASYKTSYNLGTASVTPSVNLQYIQLPLTMKLLTNQFGAGFKGFVQFGGNIDFKVGEKYQSNENFSDAQIDALGGDEMTKAIDVGLIMGLGMEYEISDIGQSVYLAFVYNRGLYNVRNGKDMYGSDKKDFMLRNDVFDLLVGFKF